jgi:hypothetical protein
MGRMDEQRLIHPHIVTDAGFAPARKAQCLDPGHADVAEVKVAIVRGEHQRAGWPILIGRKVSY